MEAIVTYTFLLISTVSSLAAIDPSVSVNVVTVNRTASTPVNLVYVASRDTNSSTHLLWGAADDLSPSILLVQSSDPNDRVEVDVSRQPLLTIQHATQSYGLIFLKLVEYNDSNDEVDFSNLTDNVIYTNLHELKWKMLAPVPAHNLSKDEVFTAEFVGERSPPNTGKIHVKVMASASQQRNPMSPRLLFLPGVSVQVECALAGLNTSYAAGRFGLQLVLLSSRRLGQGEDFVEQVVYSLDDEFTPGSFKTINLQLARAVNTSQLAETGSPEPNGFFQLRPVSYASAESRDVTSSRNLLFNSRRRELSKAQAEETRDSLGYWFYGADVLQPDGRVGMRLQDVSLGSEQDGFYASSRYLVWTLSMGIGTAPEEHFSTQLVVLLVFSMVLVAAAIFVGTAVVLVMRRRYIRPAFQRLTNDNAAEVTPVVL